MTDETPWVIFLNGSSSSGKSSLAAALQAIFPRPLLHVAADAFLSMMPRRYRALDADPGSAAAEGFLSRTVPDAARPRIDVHAGPFGHRVILGMHRSVAALADGGSDVVVDHVLLYPCWIRQAVEVLGHHRVLFVGVFCEIEELERRERERGNRQAGYAFGSFTSIHQYGRYDLEIDTSRRTPEDCAARILEHLRTGPAPTAFEQMRREFSDARLAHGSC
jgi:chloramphenicol 3-O phosphotransferase